VPYEVSERGGERLFLKQLLTMSQVKCLRYWHPTVAPEQKLMLALI